MKDDDPEKRIRELERALADESSSAPSLPYTQNAAFTGGSTQTPTPSYDFGVSPPPRKRMLPGYTIVPLVVVVISIIAGLVAVIRAMVEGSGPTAVMGNAPAGSGPTAVPQGGELRVTDNSQGRTISCNGGKLTFAGFDNKYVVTGNCASLVVGGYNNNVTVESAGTVESTGYGNTITDQYCLNAAVKLSSYGIAFKATGHCASLTISSYDNKVIVGSVDTIDVSGYNNTVTYHSGAPKVTDSGYDNNIHQG